jgi:hypothetical protein
VYVPAADTADMLADWILRFDGEIRGSDAEENNVAVSFFLIQDEKANVQNKIPLNTRSTGNVYCSR